MGTDRNNPTILRNGSSIGHLSAEADDEFLFDCFIYTSAYENIKDSSSPAMVLCGRTGSGKTAILRMIERQMESTSTVDLFDMSMSYVANSDIVLFLKTLDVDLDLFFQILWKHVLCIEFIRIRYNVCDEEHSKSVFSTITEIFMKDKRRQKAINYLKDWEGKFWITMDENIKEITDKLESIASAEFGGEIAKFKGDAGYSRKLSKEKKSELVQRAKKIVNATQLAELNQVLDLLSEESKSDMRRYYILVDQLDEAWVDDSIRFRLIRALIECLRTFRKVQNLKIVIALRTDVIERVIQETKHLGFQREKYDDYMHVIKWTQDDLRNLVTIRVKELYKKKYTSSEISITDIFPDRIGQIDLFDYIFSRTQLRPRDVLSFVNTCLVSSEGRTNVSQRIVRQSENEYSRKRLQALIEEWMSNLPTLSIIFDYIAQKERKFQLKTLYEKGDIEELIIKILSTENVEYDPIYIAAKKYFDGKENFDVKIFVKELFSELYRIGAVALKLRPDEHILYTYIDRAIIEPAIMTGDCKVYIHPMLQNGLNVSS